MSSQFSERTIQGRKQVSTVLENVLRLHRLILRIIRYSGSFQYAMAKHEEHKFCLDFIEECDNFRKNHPLLYLKHKGGELDKKLNDEIERISKKYLPVFWDEKGFYLPQDNNIRVKSPMCKKVKHTHSCIDSKCIQVPLWKRFIDDIETAKIRKQADRNIFSEARTRAFRYVMAYATRSMKEW